MTKAINVKLNDELWLELSKHDEINWSGVVRSALINKVQELDERKFDKKKARKAFLDSKKLLKSGVFSRGKTGAEIIREWRDKRRL